MTNAPSNAVIAAATPPATLAALVARLHPVPCGHELIRVGSAHDGGYLIPDDLGGIAMSFSPGVSTNADFETDLFRRSGIPSALADGSVDGPPPGAIFHSFQRMFLGSSSGRGLMRLEDWVARHRPSGLPGDLLLQMDIEGSEYAVLIDTPATVLRRFRIMVIEFHSLEWLFSTFGCMLMSAIFDKLLADFVVCHLHPNNYMPAQRRGTLEIPQVMEFTFQRRDRVRPGGPMLMIPHPLDAPCRPDKPELPLPPCWRPAAPAP
ncbi:MAG: hypothetical protein WCR51_14145 [Planctomycetia bacterium]